MDISGFIGKHYKIILPVSILLLLLASYSNSFNCEFQFDDEGSILFNPLIKSFDLFRNPSSWINQNLRTFSLFTFAINYNINELDVFGYHLVNLFIHIINTVLVFLLTHKIIRLTDKDSTDSFYFSIIIAAFFALHPIQTQAVTYIVQRMTTLSALFYLLATYAYIEFRIQWIKTKRIKSILWFILIGISLFLGFSSKQTAVSIPLMLFAIEFIVIKTAFPDKDRPYRLILISFFTLVILSLFFIPLPQETGLISRSDYIFTQIGHISRYLQLVLFPFNQTIDHYFPLDRAIFDFNFFLGVVIVIACSYIVFKNTNKLITLGICWYFISMSIESTLIPIRDTFVEHRLYHPIIGIFFIIFGLFRSFIKKEQLAFYSKSLALLLIFLASLTFVRNIKWESKISLWSDAVDEYPTNARALNNLGFAYLENNEYNKALAQLKQAVKYSKSKDTPLNNIGKTYLKLGHRDKAIQYYNMALRNNPSNVYVLNNIAEYYIITKDFEKALIYAKKALNTHKRDDLSYFSLAMIFESKGNPTKAKTMYFNSLNINPNYIPAKQRLKNL